MAYKPIDIEDLTPKQIHEALKSYVSAFNDDAFREDLQKRRNKLNDG